MPRPGVAQVVKVRTRLGAAPARLHHQKPAPCTGCHRLSARSCPRQVSARVAPARFGPARVAPASLRPSGLRRQGCPRSRLHSPTLSKVPLAQNCMPSARGCPPTTASPGWLIRVAASGLPYKPPHHPKRLLGGSSRKPPLIGGLGVDKSKPRKGLTLGGCGRVPRYGDGANQFMGGSLRGTMRRLKP